MKKIQSFILIGMSILSFQGLAQLSIGAGVGLLKTTEENSEAHFGGELALKYDLSDAFRIGVNLGFYQDAQEVFGTKFKSSLAPISVLGEYQFLDGKFKPYAGLHLGLMRAGYKVGNSSDSESYFSIAPVLGAGYEVTDNIGINLNFKYAISFYKNDFTDEIDNFSSISPNLGVFYRL